MTDSIRRSLASLDELEAWLADSGVLEIADELRRLDPDDQVVAFRLLSLDRVEVSDLQRTA